MVPRVNSNLRAIHARQRRGVHSGTENVVGGVVSDVAAPLAKMAKRTANPLLGNIGKNVLDPLAKDVGNALAKIVGGLQGNQGGQESGKPPHTAPPPTAPPPTTTTPTTPPISTSGNVPPDTPSPGKASQTQNTPFSNPSTSLGDANNDNGSNIPPQQPTTTQLTVTATSSDSIGHGSTTTTLGEMATGKDTSSPSVPLAEDQSQPLVISTTELGTDGVTTTYTSTIVTPSEQPTFVSENRSRPNPGLVVGIVIIILAILTCAIIILVWVKKRRQRIRFMYQGEITQIPSNPMLLADQGSERWSYATTESQFSIGLDRNGSYSANSVGLSNGRVPMTQNGSRQYMSVVPSYQGLQQYHSPITAGSTADLDDPFITPPTSPRLTALESPILPDTLQSDRLEAGAAVVETVETFAVHKGKVREDGRLIWSSSNSKPPV